MSRKICTLTLLLWSWLILMASGPLQVSLITCWPGDEVYELYGHTALRVRGTSDNGVPFDSVWNYGVFNYSDPNFIGRFVKGELMYQVAGYPFAWFMPEYIHKGRHVEEQILNLSSEQAASLHKALQINALPANRVYLYDYVKDNCSTRVWDKIETAAGGITLPPGRNYATYRKAMRAYHSHYPWYSLGIDMALAYPVDTLVTDRDLLFLPIELHDKMAAATLADGSKAVAATNILNEGVADATLPPTPWYLTPLFWNWILTAIVIVYTMVCIRRRRSMKWLEAIFFGLMGIAGCIIAFLVFFSIHRASSPNLLVTCINPLALIVPALIWSDATRPVVVAYMTAQSIVLVIMAMIWPFQTQCGNAAFIPIALSELILSVSYIYLYINQRKQLS